MKATMKTHHEWQTFLNFYAEQNKGRPTRLGVFENINNTAHDYWLEDGMPLDGIDLDESGGSLTIQMMFGTYTHVIENVTSVRINLTRNGTDDGVDVFDSERRTTILRFETDASGVDPTRRGDD